MRTESIGKLIFTIYIREYYLRIRDYEDRVDRKY